MPTKAEELLTGLLELLKTPPLMDEPLLSKHFFWAASLIPVCLQNLLSKSNLSCEAYDLAIAAIFLLEEVNRYDSSYFESSGHKNMETVQQLVSPHEELRQRLFWKRVTKYREQNGREPRVFELDGHGTLVELVKDDLGWLLADAGSNLPIVDRQLVLEVAADKLWSARQSLLASTWKLFRQTGGKPEFVAVCRQYAWNRMRAPFMGVWYRHIRHKLLEKWWWKRRLHHIQKFRQKIYDRWWLWRHLGDLRKGHYPVTLAYFARLVVGDTGSQYGGSDWSKVSEEWGSAITDAAKRGCMVGWRRFSPLLPHEKPERNSVDHRVAIGLVGLQTLWSEEHLDFSVLTADEVSLLVRYACNELNGLPEWFSFLLSIRPTEAAKSLGEAMAGEWNYPAEMEHVHDVVAKLAWMSSPIEMVAQVVMNRLQVSDPLNPRMLEYALTVLIRSGENLHDGLLALAITRVHNYTPDQAQWLNWMNIWLQIDALPALDYLEGVLIEPGTEPDALVVRLCSVMSGRFGEQQRVSNPSFLKPAALARFIPLVHRHVRTAEDIERANQGVYSPGARDHTQEFRSRLLEELRSSVEPEADEVLRTLLDEPILNDRRDWIRHLLDGRKYLRADNVAWEAADIRVFAKQYCSEPRSDYQLFRLVSRLLRGIKNHVEQSENAANRLQVRSGDLEKDFRGFLCGKLSEQSLNWFSVTQEAEVDLGQRPDLHVDRPGLNPLPIEIKLANLTHWTVAILLERLENQLIGQYLRPANVRYGIYVLGNTEPKKRWKVSGAEMNFAELVSHVQERAAALQAQLREGVDGIEVVGIDFSDPREK